MLPKKDVNQLITSTDKRHTKLFSTWIPALASEHYVTIRCISKQKCPRYVDAQTTKICLENDQSMIRFFFDTNTVVSFIYDSCETQRAKHEVHSPYVHLSTIDHRPVEVSKLFHSGFKQIYNMVLATISLPEILQPGL